MTHDEAALHWLMRSQSGTMTQDERARHAEWLLGNGDARRAWGEALNLWRALGQARPVEDVGHGKGQRMRRWLPAVAAMAASLLIFAMAAWMLPWLQGKIGPAEVSSQIASGDYPLERTLPDGSTVLLDRNSEIRVAMRGSLRRIELTHGHAFFQVAHDKSRAFVVQAGDMTVTALGTRFGVYNDGRQAREVFLTQGIVRAEGRTLAPLIMHAGTRLSTSGLGWTSHKVDMRREVAWSQQRHLFEGVPLREAAFQVQRYGSGRIEVDPAITSVRVSGVFPFGDSRAFAEAVTGLNARIVAEQKDGVMHLRLRK